MRYTASASAPLLKADGSRRDNKSLTETASFILPPVIFAGVTLAATYFFNHYPGLVWAIVGLCLFIGGIFFLTGGQENDQPLMFLGLMCLGTVVLGGVVGGANYSWHMRSYYHFVDSREYTNVLPSEPAAAHADAGKIIFSAGAVVDKTKSVGYNHGSLYCVAPIIDTYTLPRVEYWAVGVDCCAPRSDFACDDALKGGVRGGMVISDGGFLQHGNAEYYHRAVQVAQAAFDLQSAPEPIYVRWVADPTAVNDALLTTATLVCVGAIVGQILLNSGVALAVKYYIMYTNKSRM